MENQLIPIYLAEYDKLKQEQISRIGFRDNLIYVTITAIGGVTSFIISEKITIEAILIIPWVCSILGWIYLRNDEKISLLLG